MAISAGQVFVDLGARLDRREFEAYERQLRKVQERTAKREHFKAELGANFDSRAFNAYERELKKAERETDNQVRAQGRLRTAFGSVYGRGGAMFAAAGGIAAFVVAGKSVIGTASDINESLTKNQVLFGRFAKDVDKFSKTSAASFGISRKSALEYAGTFGNLFRAFGTSQQKSAEFSTQLTKLAADMASFNNTSIEEALEAIRSGLVGESEPLRKFGVNINDTALKAEALASGLVKAQEDAAKFSVATVHLEDAQHKAAVALKEHGQQSLEYRKAQATVVAAQSAVLKATQGTVPPLTAQQKAMAAMQLTMKQTAAAHGDFARTSSGLANQQRILRARISDLGAEIGTKLLPIVLKGAQDLNKFIDGMRTGRGVGGQFAAVLSKLGRAANKFGEDFNDNERQVGGWVTGLGRAESTVLKLTGTLVGGRAGDQLREWGRNVDRNADQIDRWREQLRIDREVDGIERDIRRLRRTTSGSFRDIRVATKTNMDEIRDSMTLESAAGRRAFGRNIRAAVTAIRDAMKDGRVSAQTGLAEIRKLMLTQLRELGIRSAERVGAPLTQDPAAANRAQRYMGGWLGGRGLVGHDSIPAMLAPGEAVLNRHQQAVIEGMLGEGFLDRLFAQVNRPHFMQKGGRIPFAAGGLAPAVSRLANSLVQKFGLTITSTTGGTHVPGSYHYQGLAADLGGSASSMSQASEWIKSSGTYRSLLEGIHNPNLAVKNGQIFPGAGPFGSVWANHASHIHIALRAIGAIAGGGGGGGPAGAAWKAISAPQTSLTGLLGQIVQGTLNQTTAGANRRGRSLVASLGGGDITSQGTARGAGADVVAAFRRAISSSAASPLERLALWEAGIVESGLKNLNFGDRDSLGALQERTSIYGRAHALDPFASAMRFLHQAIALRPFSGTAGQLAQAVQRSAFPGRYDAVAGQARQYMRRGGFARFAKGGRAGVGGERAWLNRSWAQVAPLFGLPADSKLGSLFKHIRFSKANAFVGVSSSPGAKGHETDELLWPRWLWQSSRGQKALDDRSKLQLFIHEMAHRFQSHEATPSEWETEGGAEAFARIAMDRQFGGRRSSKGDPYNAFVTRVVKRRGMDWIARAQFGKATGGFANFARGGRAGSKLAKTAGGATAGLIRKIRPLQTDRSQQFEALMARVDSADQNYSRWERRFNITDEELVDSDTGQVNVAAVQRKAKELGQLILIRAGMERDLEMARDVAKRIVASYRKVVTALRNSLRHSTKKNRKGIQSYINQYQPRIAEWQGKVDEASGSLFDATTDKLELRAELRDVLGTAPELRDTTADTGTDTGADTTGPDTTADTTTAPPTPLQIAEGVAAEMRTFLSGRQDLLQSFGRNYLTPGGAGGYFSGRDALDASAGARFFGGSAGGGSLGGLSGGSTVIANFASAPDNAPTFVQQMRFLVENGSAG